MEGTTLSNLDEDAYLRNIVDEIIRQCKSKQINVNKNFVIFLTKLLLLNPNWGVSNDFLKQRHNENFVEYIIDELLAKQDSPKVVTLKIQFYFSCSMDNAEHIVQAKRNDLKNRLKILSDDILGYYKFNNKRDIDVLYKKMVYYITFSSGLGNPGISKIYEEVLVALKSILNEDELRGFVELPKKDKLAQLNQCTFVVGGIRIFNKDCNKGGEGITNLPQLMPQAIAVIKENTEDTLLSIMEKVNLLTTAVGKSYALEPINDKGYKMSLQNPVELNEALRQPDIYYMQNLLIFFRQYELIVRQILEEMVHIQERCEISLVGMEKLIKIIHDTVDMKIGVPAELVFPLFENLWLRWEQFQNESFLLTTLNDIMNNLYHFSKQTGFHKFDVLVESMTDAERLAENLHLSLTSVNPELSIIKHENIKNMDSIKLQYLGFCCWMLVQTDGGLIPGNPHMGIVEYKGKYYVFSSYEAYNMFAIDPQIYVNGVLELGRNHPQLVNFLQLQKDLEGVSNIEKLVQVKIEIRGCDDKYVQTDDNFEPYIDPNYKWNVWELKREALIKTNLSCRHTASTQTRNTSSKYNIRTQTYETGKMVACQTTRNVYTDTSKSAQGDLPTSKYPKLEINKTIYNRHGS